VAGIKLLATCAPGEVRIAAWNDGAADCGLVDYAIWRPGTPDGVGDVHRGRITALAPALGGAFLAIAGGDGFLADRTALTLAQGAAVTVRVIRAPQGGKGPRLARAETDAGPGPVALLSRGPSPLQDLAARHTLAPIELDDPSLVPELRPLLGDRLRLVPRAWNDDIETEVAALESPEAPFPGGGRMTLTPTPALVAIDLDTGSAIGGEKATAQMAANLAALPVLAAQIRLRNLSGAILVDFAGLPARKRAALRPALEAALRSDPLFPRLLGFTALGLAEILRPRIRASLHETLSGPLSAGLTALRHIAARVATNKGKLPVLRAAPTVVAALQADPIALQALAARAGQPLMLRSDPALPGTMTIIEEAA
jgi:ribonuclease G